MAKKRRKVSRKRRTHTNPPNAVRHHKKRRSTAQKHHRRYRRNPPMKRIMTQVYNGAIDAAEVLGGKAGARIIPAMFGFAKGTPMNLIGQAVTAVIIGFVAHKFINANAGKMMLAGGLASPMEDVIKGLNIPILSPALGEGDELHEIAAYPMDMLSTPDMSSYPMGATEEDDEEAALTY